MSHVTPQTALKLKAAGFPQPKISINQCWYSGTRFFQITGTESPLFIYERSNELPEWLSFAPTAEDILEHLPTSCSVRKGIGFEVKHQYHQQEFALYKANTLVEALAKAYLNIFAPK